MCTRRNFVILLVLVLVGAGSLSTFSTPLIAAEVAEGAEGSSEWVNAVFQSGKTAYYEGDYTRALAQWDRLGPYLSEPGNASVRRMVDFLKSRIKDQLPASAPVDETASLKAKAPVGLKETVSSAVDRLDSETTALESGRRASDESLIESQKRVNAAFENGRRLYEQGRIPEAVSVWKTIAPLVENGESLASALDALDKKYREYEAARRSAEAAESASGPERPIAPRELMSVLNATNEKLRQETLEAQKKVAETDREVSKQQVWILQTFQRGEDLYDQGRYDEALKEWDSIAPYLKGQDEAEQLYMALRENYREAIEAKQNAEAAASGRQVKFKAPPEFLTLLNQADRKLKQEAEDAAARQNDSEAMFSQKAEQLRTLYEKGKFLFEDGQYKEAIDVWNQMAPNFADEVQIKTSLRFIDSNYAKWLDAQEAAKKATVRKDGKVPAPTDFQAVLDGAARRLEEETRGALNTRQSSEKALSERQAMVNATFLKGRTLFEAGRAEDALKTWETLLPYIDSQDEIGRQISLLRQNLARAETEKKAAAELSAKVDAKAETPDAFVRLLTQATQDLESAADKARNDRSKMEKTIADRQAWIRSTFEEGRRAYQQGEIEEALRQWEKLEPYLDETQGVREMIARVKETHSRTSQARREADTFAANEYKNLKLPFAEEMNSFLTEADAGLRAETDRAVSERRQMEKTVSERQAWITDTFQKGRAEYQAGDIDNALTTWDSITPYLRDGSRVKVFIEQIRQNSAAAKDAKAESENAAKKKDMRFESPEGLSRLLDSVSQKYIEEKQTAMMRQADAEKSVDDRKAWLMTTFSKGKSAYQAGDLKGAFTAWKEMMPYLENESEIREAIQRLEEEARAAEAARLAAEEAAAKKGGRQPAPAELATILGQATAKLESEIRIAADQRAQAESTATQRQAWIQSTFEAGRKLYDEGRFKEALDVWKEIVPYTDEASGLRQAMAAAQSAYQGNLEAQTALEAARAEADTKFKAGEELSTLLTDMRSKMVSETAAAETAGQKALREHADRQRGVADAFEKGRALYERGNYAEAVKYWEMIPPHVENGAAMRETLAGLRAAADELAAARAEAENASLRERSMLEPPRELESLLGNVDQKLKEEAEEARQEKTKAEQSLASRQSEVDAIYAKGKALQAEGRYTDAVAEWQKLANYFDETSGVPQKIQQVSAELKIAQSARRDAVDAAANEYKLIQAPSELDKVVAEASSKLVAEAQASRAAEVRSRQALTDRQTWLDETFAKAVDLQKQGNYEGSLKLWAQMMPYLKENPQAQQAIVTLKQNYDAFIEAKNASEEAGSALHQKPKVPADLVPALTEANERLKNDTEIASQRTAESRRSFEERKAYVEDTLRKAQQLYQDGKVREALETWNTAAAYFEDDGQLKAALNAVDISLGAAEDAKRTRDAALAKENEKIKASDAFRGLINQAKRALDEEARAALDQKAAAERSFAEREKLVADTVAKGAALAEQGRVADAIDAWASVTPYLEGEAAWKKTVEQLRQNYEGAVRAQNEAKQSQAAAAAKLAAPEGYEQALALAQQQLDFSVQESADRKAKMEKEIADRKAMVLAQFQKGAALFGKHQYPEAFAEWDKMTPHLDQNQGVLEMLEKVKRTYAGAEESARQTNEFAHHQYRDLRVPFADEMKKMLADADQRLTLQIHDTDAKRAEMEKDLAARQALIEQTFAKGRTLLENGRYAEAMEAWGTLLPHLNDTPKVKASLESLAATYAKYQDADRARAEALARQDQKVPAPAELHAMMAESVEKLKSQTADADSQVKQIDQNNAARRQRMLDTYQKGRILYEQGKYREAVDTWNTLQPYLSDDAELEAAVKDFNDRFKDLADSRQKAREALERKDAKLRAPDELLPMLSGASDNLRLEADGLRDQTAQLEKSIADRQQYVLENFNKGKELYEQRKFAEAAAVWDQIVPFMENEEVMRALMAKVAKAQERLAEAREAAENTAVQQSMKLAPPEEMPKVLASAEQQLSAAVDEALARKAKMEKEIADRKAMVLAQFQKGAALFGKHQYPEAFAEWDKMTPHLDQNQGVREVLEAVRQKYERAEQSWKQTNEYAQREYKDLRVPFADEMKNMLSGAGQKLDLQTRESEAKRAEMQKTLADRQAWLNQNYAKGKELLENGRYDEAVETWSALLPYIEDDSKVKRAIEAFEENHKQLRAARQAHAEADSRKDAKFKLPDELFKMLGTAGETLKNNSFESKNEIARIDKANAEREQQMFGIYQRGRTLFEQGKYREAVDTWKGLDPYVADNAALAAAVKNFEANYQANLEAQTQAQAALQRKDSKMRAPEELLAMLARASENMSSDANQSRSEALLLEKSNAERQQFVLENFNKGKELYDQGKFKEATDVWDQILPYLDEEAMLRDSVQSVEETYENLMEAKKQAASATVQQDMKFETPEELPRLLVDVQQRFKLDGMKALGETAQAEKSRAEREEWLRATFMKGKQLFNEGRYPEAIEAWRAMTTYLADPTKIEQMLNDLEQNFQTTLAAKKAAEDAAAKQDRKFTTPPDLVQFLRQADESLKNETFVAQSHRSRTEQSFSDKQQFINQTYMAGKALYEEGKYGPAVSEWSKLGPYLDEASGLPKLLDTVKKSYDASLEAKRSAVEAAAGEYKGLQLSYKDQMSKLLDEANAKLIKETAQARSRQSETEQTLAERKEWAVTTFNKGKILYDQARYDEALELWERLVPFLGEDSFLAKQIETMRKNYNVSIEAKTAVESLTQGKTVPAEFKEGSQLSLELEQMSLKFKDEADKYRDQAATYDKSIAERKDWMSFVYKKGKDLYEQGKYDDALAQWDLLSPYLGEQPDLARMLERAKAMAAQKKSAVTMAMASKDKSESLVPLPPTAAGEIASMPEPSAPATPQASVSTMPTMPSSGALPLKTAPEPAAAAEADNDSIQFVSGEVTSVDDLQKTITLKPYTAGKADTVTVAFDEGTQVSSTESNQSINTLQRGAAIDIRYDLKTSRAVYVYIY